MEGIFGMKIDGICNGQLRPPPNGDSLFQNDSKFETNSVENLGVTIFSHCVGLDGIHTPSFHREFFIWDLPAPLEILVLIDTLL